jgi:proline racemase
VPPTSSVFETWSWQAPSSWSAITTIDTHTGGEPLRIVTSGLPPIPGSDVLAKRRYFMEHHDTLRTGLLREPRGHADMYGAILTPAADDADLDVFFINTEGYSPMCGHAILAIATVVIETGLIERDGPTPTIIINTPAGRNYARAQVVDGTVVTATFENVPSFVYLRDEQVSVPGLGEVPFDVAFGGAFYALVDADALDLDLSASNYHSLVEHGRSIKRAIVDAFAIEHPFEPELSSLFGVIFTGRPEDPANHSRNVNVFEDGEVDRSATGTGVSARAALHVARGEVSLGETIAIESIVGSTMTVTALRSETFGGHDAIVPEVGGAAHIMGRSEFYFDPSDPFSAGFLLR